MLFSRLMPALRSYPNYGRGDLGNDVIAGITVALVLIPQSMAYAQLAGLPAYYGLYAAFLPVAVAALLGIAVNLGSARLFGHNHSHDLNRRAAVVHLLTDAAVSAAVLVSALLIQFTGIHWLDPFTGIGVGLAVAWSGWTLLRQSVLVSLDGVPPGIDRDAGASALMVSVALMI